MLSFLCLQSALIAGVTDGNPSFSDEELRQMLFGDETADQLIERPSSPKIKWIPAYAIESGIGFSDNPLYGPFIREEAAYWENSLEGFFLIESQPEYSTHLYLYGEGKIFEDLPAHGSTSVFLGQFDHAFTPKGSDQTYGLRLRHTFYDQGFDFSQLGLPYLMSVQSEKSEAIPYFSQILSKSLTIEVEIFGGVEDFKSMAFDNKEEGISLSLQGSPEPTSWSLEAEYLEKKYRERPRRAWDASSITGESLAVERTTLSLSIERKGDLDRLQSTGARLQWTQLRDDADGYYDHQRLSLSLDQKLIFSIHRIDLAIEGSLTEYDSRLTDAGQRFRKEGLSGSLAITRSLSEDFDAYFRWSREEDFSNAREYEYHSNFWSLGVIWEI